MDDYDDREIDDFEDDEHGYDCDCDACRYEHAVDECGLLPEHLGGGCTLAGTEQCDWDCPIRPVIEKRNEQGDSIDQ